MGGPRSRRAFLQATTAAGVAATATAQAGAPPAAAPSSFLPMLRPPDRVFAHVDGGRLSLETTGPPSGAAGCKSRHRSPGPPRSPCQERPSSPPHPPPMGVGAPPRLRVLGDHWERGYGDLEWRGVVPERPMPWFFLTHDGRRTHGYGVRTGTNAFAHWQVDAEGVSLWLDIRCGGRGVELAGRTLEVATVVAREGRDGSRPSQPPGPSAPCCTTGLGCPRPRLRRQQLVQRLRPNRCRPHPRDDRRRRSTLPRRRQPALRGDRLRLAGLNRHPRRLGRALARAESPLPLDGEALRRDPLEGRAAGHLGAPARDRRPRA